MADASDAKPAGGYLFPELPGEWTFAPTNLLALCGLLDQSLDAARVEIDTLDNAHVVTRATGSNLDDLGALLGIPRGVGESDAAYAVRIPATVQHGVSALNNADMATYLQTALGVGASVTDGPAGSASFVVTIVGNTPLLSSTPKLVRVVKALGTVFVVYAVIPTVAAGGARTATFRAAGRRVGGDGETIFVGS